MKRRNEGKEVRRLSFVDAAVPVATGWRLEVGGWRFGRTSDKMRI